MSAWSPSGSTGGTVRAGQTRGLTGVGPGVAWSESTLAGVRWLHLVGDRLGVFRQLGWLAQAEIRAVQAAMPERASLRRWVAGPRGGAVLTRLRAAAARDYPEVLAELRAIAEGAGVDAEELLIANLRGDIGVPDGTGCSDLAFSGKRSFVAHNEDGAPALDGPFMFVTLGIDDQPSVTTQWYPGFLPCNAHTVTSAGLAWGINHIQVREPADAAGRHFLARRLQGAADLKQALTWLCTTPTAGGFAYTLGELGTGRVAVVEIAAGDSAAVSVEFGALAWHTNHLRWLPAELDTADGASEVTDSLGMRAESEARGAHLSGREVPAEPDTDWFLEVLADRPLPEGVRREAAGDDPLMTLMTTVVDLDRRLVTLRSSAGEQVELAVNDFLKMSERGAMQDYLRTIS